jgi:hypothetical protein
MEGLAYITARSELSCCKNSRKNVVGDVGERSDILFEKTSPLKKSE